MNKKLIIIIVVLIVLAGGAFAAYKYWPSGGSGFGLKNNNQNTNTSLPGGDNANIDNSDDNGDVVIRQIEENYLGIPFLENLSDEELKLLMRSDNYLDLSHMKNVCDRKSQDLRNDCYDSIKIRQASIVANAGLCNQLSGKSKDTCFRNIAYKNNDMGICANISDQNMKSECQKDMTVVKAQKDKNIVLCLDLSQENRNSCVSSVLSGEADENYCSNDFVTDNGLSDICKSVIYMNKAFVQGDSSICEQIPLEEYKAACVSELSEHDNSYY